MAFSYIPADGGPRALHWPLGSSDEEHESSSISGPTGIWLPKLFPKSLRVLAIDFASDHRKKMTDKGYFRDTKHGDFEPGGDPFPDEWTYRADPDIPEARPYPIGHTGDRHVDLFVAVNNEYPHSVAASLTGSVITSDVADGMRFDLPERTFEPGITIVRIISNVRLHKRVQAVEFKIRWEFAGPRISATAPSDSRSIHAPPTTTTNEMFVTLGEPQFEGNEITYERMAHAVEKAGAANSGDPHQVIEALVHSLKLRFGKYGTDDAWFFARLPDSELKIDCISQARYIAALAKMVGIHGTVEPVIVYVETKGIKFHSLPDNSRRLVQEPTASDLQVVEKADPGGGFEAPAGLNQPIVRHPSKPWHLMFVLGPDVPIPYLKDVPNAFEGCVKFTPRSGTIIWYPAGTKYPGQSTLKGVLRTTFKSLSWFGDDDKQPKQFVENYR